MVLEFVKYIVLDFAATAGMLIIWGGLAGILGFLEEKQATWKSLVAISTFLCAVAGAYVLLSAFHVYMPRLFEDKALPDADSLRKQVDASDRTGTQLITAFEHPELLTLQQLRDLVDTAREYATQTTALNRIQESQTAVLRQTVEKETARAREAEELAAKVRSITSEQLDAVKFLITKDASEQAKQSFINGVIASFPLGIVASILGSAIWDRFIPKKRRVLTKIEGIVNATVSTATGAAQAHGGKSDTRPDQESS